MIPIWKGTSTCFVLLLGAAGVAAAADIQPTNLRCEYQSNPLAIDTPRPRLSWVLLSERRGQRQTAYQVLVASSVDRLRADRPDLWDSGVVASADSLGIVYRGRPLRSGVRAWWKVRVWDMDGRPSADSEPAWWEMALLSPDDWQGRWIARNQAEPADEAAMYAERPAPMFRKGFTVRGRIREARAYVSGLGYCELHINGQKVGNHVLDPGWTEYATRVPYCAYDVTSLLAKGPNAIGVIVGNGWYNPLPLRLWGHIDLREHLTVGRPCLIVQLSIEYADGSRESVVTDATWKVGDSPILKNNIYLGEVYDARRESPGWDTAGFDDQRWPLAVAGSPGLGRLRVQSCPPVRVDRTLKPVALSEPEPGVFIFDMGQNFAGWTRLRLNGHAGMVVTLRYGELLHHDGTLNEMTSVCGQIKKAGVGGPGAPDVACQADTYISKGEPEEVYVPRFTFHGFRYVEVTGLRDRPSLDTLEGMRLCAAVEPVGSFSCSNDTFNRIQEMILWTQLSNMFSVQSDCPHRERFGYGGDIIVSGETAMFNFDMSRFYAKAVQDLQESARTDGGLTETAPFVGIADSGFGNGSGPIEWGTAHPLLLWELYRYYGDIRLMREQYDTAVRWVELLKSKAVDGIIDNGLSDHETLVPKPTALTGTAFYYLNADLLSRIADVLGRKDEARRYRDLAATIKAAFNRRFLKHGTGGYDTRTQACQAVALYLNLVPELERNAALAVLVNDVAAHQGHLTTGIFGTRFMLQALSDLGRADVACTIAGQKTFPGWGHMLECGATTLWEHWELSDNVYSHNHPMFSSVGEWFYKNLAGIRPHPAAFGYDRMIITPCVVGGLTWARGEYESIRGRITSHWRLDSAGLTLKVKVPVNATAVVHIPARNVSSVTEGVDRRPLVAAGGRAPAEGVRFVGMCERAAVCEVASGTYLFRSEGFRPSGR